MPEGKTMDYMAMKLFAGAVVLMLSLAMPADSQSGGGFLLTETVIAGGGEQSTADGFTLDATIGQPGSGGPLTAGRFVVTSGFWNYAPLAPTAAGVTISGRIVTAEEQGIPDARVFLQTQQGEIFVARSASFGYYIFEDIVAGQSVFVTVEHKLFTFPPQTVTVLDSVTGLDFVGQPR